MTTASNMEALERLSAAVDEVQHVRFDTMAQAEHLRYVRHHALVRRSCGETVAHDPNLDVGPALCI